MKKTFLTIMLVAASFLAATSQTQYDALNLTQTDLNGTARYMGMGGAFGALGGDAASLNDNPAGLGVYRSSELTTTLNLSLQNTTSDWYNNKVKESQTNFKLNNFSYVLSIPYYEERTSGLMYSNFSFSYNKLRNYGRKMSAQSVDPVSTSFTDFLADFTTESMNKNGTKLADLQSDNSGYDPYTNERIPWLSVMGYQAYLINPPATDGGGWSSVLYNGEQVYPSAYVSEYGALNEFTFGWGGNFNNNLFIGANLGIMDMSYSLLSQMSETFTAVDGYFDLTSHLDQSGIGVNLKLGAIYLPTNNVRLGFAVHTPTFYSISEYTNFDLQTSETASPYLPDRPFTQDYSLRSAAQVQLSGAYLFGNKGLISAEYNFINYPGMRFSYQGSSANYQDENGNMGTVLQNGHVLKLGGEFKVNPGLSLRAGYAVYTSPMNKDYHEGKSLSLNTASTNTEYFVPSNTNYATFGIGYREANWFIDFAYALKMQNENFYPYQILGTTNTGLTNTVTPATVRTNTNNLIFTLGLRM
ncbi:MAG: OmpP1/FadL family transporter [Paludibacteraceae bacterium]